MATHTVSKQVKLYLIHVKWPAPKAQNEQAPSLAAIVISHLTYISVCTPSSPHLMGGAHAFGLMGSPYELTHLELVPTLPDVTDPNHTSKPRLLANFSPVLENSTSEMYGVGQSVTSIWEISEESPQLDESFLELTSKKGPAGALKTEYYLRPLDEVMLHRIAVQITQVYPGSLLAVSLCDGTTLLRDRSLAILPPDENPDKTSGLAQVGFVLSAEPGLHAAVSSSHGAVATFGLAHDPKLFVAHLPLAPLDPGAINRVSAAIALSITAAEGTTAGHFDLQMVLHGVLKTLPDDLRGLAALESVRETCRAVSLPERLNRQIDVRTMQISSVLAMQLLTADLTPRGYRSVRWKVAWVTLNLRHLAMTFGLLLKEPENKHPGKYDIGVLRDRAADVGFRRDSFPRRCPALAHQFAGVRLRPAV